MKKLSPNLTVSDMDKMIDFYADVLGFRVTNRVPENPPYVWVSVEKGGVELMLQTRASFAGHDPDILIATPVGNGMMLYIELESIAELGELLEECRRANAVVKEPFDTFYGRKEFMAADPEGYLFCFAAPHNEAGN